MTDEVVRFSKVQIVIHGIVGLAIMLLILTGLPIMFAENLYWFVSLLGGPNVATLIHQIAAIAMIFASTFYLVHFLLVRLHIKGQPSILPEPKDLRDMIQDMKYIFGISKERPRIEKYDWIRKFNMTGVALSSLVMILSGAIVWLPEEFAGILFNSPAAVIAVRTIHAGTAFFFVLFLLAHTTSVHLRPDKFPMDMTISTGKMPVEDVIKEFPAWAEKMGIAAEVKGGQKKGGTPIKPALVIWLGGVATALLVLFTVSLSFTQEGLAGLRLVGAGAWATLGLTLVLFLVLINILATALGYIRARESDGI